MATNLTNCTEITKPRIQKTISHRNFVRLQNTIKRDARVRALQVAKPAQQVIHRQAMAKWLQDERFNFFCTFTTPYELTPASARRMMGNYGRRLKENGIYAFIFWVTEFFELKDGCHLHALMRINNAADDFLELAAQIAKDVWQQVSIYKGQVSTRKDGKLENIVHISKMRPNNKAAPYVCAYVGKELTDYDLIY